MSKQQKVRLKNIEKENEENMALFNEALNGNGHNSTREKLRQTIARIERLEEEKQALADDIKEVYNEAKGFGFDPAIIKIIIRRRKEDIEKRREREMTVETYEAAIDGRQLDLFEKGKTENETPAHDPETGEITDEDDDEEDEDDEDFEDIDD